MLPETAVVDSAPEAIPDRWVRWVKITTAVQVVFLFFYPGFICGCHFHAIAVPLGIVPVGWGFYPFFCYRTRREHVVGYVNGALSIFWLYFTWDSNIQFAFR